MKLFLKIFGIFLVIVILFGGAASFIFMRELNEVKNFAINDVNPTVLDDGIYHGKMSAGLRTNELAVTVKGHRIVRIDIVKDAMFPVKESRLTVYPELFREVIEKQSTKVDVVSGATVTTKQYLKSIENALNK